MTSYTTVACDFCGTQKRHQVHNVLRNQARNGGLYRCLACKQEQATHHKGTAMHTSYTAAKGRCTNPKAAGFVHYGGRGIEFRWACWRDFLRDMGPSYFAGATLERVNVNGHYEPANCRWATRQEQAHNTRRNIHTLESVAEIRRLYAAGVTQVALAKRFGDSQGNISNIILNRTWATS